jgi:hypothetical protein
VPRMREPWEPRMNQSFIRIRGAMSTNGGLKPPAPTPEGVLTGVDVAAKEAVKQAEEAYKALYAKALDAQEHVKELLASAGVALEATITPPSKDKEDEGSEGKKPSVPQDGALDRQGPRGTGLPTLPSLPCGRTPVKAMTKRALEMITTLLQTTTVTPKTPEHMLVLWGNISRAVQMAGLTEAEVQAVVGMVTGEAAVSLCITHDGDLDRWAQHAVSGKRQGHLADASAARLKAQRERDGAGFSDPRQAAVAGGGAAADAAEGAVIKTVWSKDALGDDYFKLNSIGFMRIDDKLKDGTIRDMGQLQAHVQELSGYEQVPEVAAPVVPKERHTDRNKKKALCLQNKHMGHTAEECWVLHPDLAPWNQRRNPRTANTWPGSNNNNNEADASEYMAAPVGRDAMQSCRAWTDNLASTPWRR